MRIALIAMSGVRIRDPDLLALGLTLPGFVERGEVIASLPSLSLLTLAALTPSEHSCHYLEAPDRAASAALPTDFDLVAISSFSAQIDEAYELADRMRAAGCQVVIGGPHVSILPDEAAAHVDAVIIGEGECSWPQVVDDCARGRLRARYGRRGQAFDLRHAPLPRFDLLDLERYNRLTVQTSRGCPHRCSFCAATPLMTPGYRQKPLNNVLAELDAIQALWPHPFIEFADDNSFVNKRWWKDLLREMIPRNIRWFTECDISVADDDELLELIAAAGCAQILIGLESPNASGLDGVERNRNWKLKQADHYRRQIDRIHGHGISVNACFVFGLDGHTPATADAIVDFVDACELSEVQVTIPTPFPGTAFYDDLAHAGRLLQPTAWDRCTLFDINFRPHLMSVDELRDTFASLVTRLYNPQATAIRRQRFRAIRRNARQRHSNAPAA
ncbi:MAG: B12-binding domain-containing radical SAM protein [Planctomycetota bacterium]|jgi:radical SAM superfamily enzyme YgiQ (UPF0313 family)